MALRLSLVVLPLFAAGILMWSMNRTESSSGSNEGTAQANSDEPPANIILLIGDGMGPQQVGLLFDWADATANEPTELERLMKSGEIGVVRTGASNSPLTDSAASATAIATGVRTKNGYVGVGPSGERLTTVLELAARKGMKTGLVTSTRVTHATPASFAAHVNDREQEDVIAQQLVASPTDVILGGGKYYFLSEKHSLSESIRKAGWTLATDRAALAGIAPDTRTLGLFSETHLPYRIDRDAPGEKVSPTLPELTREALRILGQPKPGFFLMIEGGRIDHAGHANDVAGVLGEMREFDETLALALEYQRSHPNTLVLVTADHETGGLCVTKGKRKLSMEDFVAMGNAEASAEVLVPDGKLPATTKAEPFGTGRSDFYPRSARPLTYGGLTRSAQWNVSFGSQGHSTTPVYLLSIGPGAREFRGLHHHTSVGRILVEWMR